MSTTSTTNNCAPILLNKTDLVTEEDRMDMTKYENDIDTLENIVEANKQLLTLNTARMQQTFKTKTSKLIEKSANAWFIQSLRSSATLEKNAEHVFHYVNFKLVRHLPVSCYNLPAFKPGNIQTTNVEQTLAWIQNKAPSTNFEPVPLTESLYDKCNYVCVVPRENNEDEKRKYWEEHGETFTADLANVPIVFDLADNYAVKYKVLDTKRPISRDCLEKLLITINYIGQSLCSGATLGQTRDQTFNSELELENMRTELKCLREELERTKALLQLHTQTPTPTQT